MSKVEELDSCIKKYGLFWQYPVITEREFYNQNKHDLTYFGFPWATVIDKSFTINQILCILVPFIKRGNSYFTCCQHISFRSLVPVFKHLNIKTLFSPHKIKGEDYIDGIRINPCPLYAVNYEDPTRNAQFQNIDFKNIKRELLYSFVGGLQAGYLTDVRKKIFKITHQNVACVINTGDWHFNNIVYSSKQDKNNTLNINTNHIIKTNKYNEILLNSRFSLCPSGSGPNSIRLWESLACGSIPVLLADTLDLPKHPLWEHAIIRICEKDVANVPQLLSQIGKAEEQSRRHNCLKIYNFFHNNYRNL